MPTHRTTRRALLGSAAFATAGLTLGRTAGAQERGTDFAYEVRRSEAEWRAQLAEDEYQILREGGTEWPQTSALWDDYAEGRFDCRGCDLALYDSEWRAPIDKGWVFFYHAHPDTVLTGIDTAEAYTGMVDPNRTLIEVHCRRCGSHLGHILNVEGEIVHCINGTSLAFSPLAA